jgi:hypothetical protein
MSDENAAHPLMVMLFGQQSFVGDAEKVENEIMPLEEQLAFDVGDCAIIAQANTQLENDLVFVQMLSAIDHQDTFPDWADREMNSFVLCEYFSAGDKEFNIGWFSRLKLLPIKKYRYKQARGWRKNGFPNEMPEWIMANHEKYTEQLSKHSPETVPRVSHCPNCQSTDVEIVVIRKLEYRGRVGVLTIDGHEFYVPVTDPVETSTHIARLHCKGCDSKADLADDEWQLPGISN